MSSEVQLSKLPKGDYGEVFQYQVKAEFKNDDIIVKVCHLGRKHIYNSNEILFTRDGKSFEKSGEFFYQLGCDLEEALSDHFHSIGFTVVDKIFTPILSTQMLVRVQF